MAMIGEFDTRNHLKTPVLNVPLMNIFMNHTSPDRYRHQFFHIFVKNII